MTTLTSQEEANLKRLLAARADHLEVPQPYPAIDRSLRRERARWLTVPAVAAAILLLAFGTYRLGADKSTGTVDTDTSPAAQTESIADGDGDLLVFVFPADRTSEVWDNLEELGHNLSIPSTRRGLTDQEFTTYWADFPQVLAAYDQAGWSPASLRVALDDETPRNQMVGRIKNLEGVVRVDAYPACNQNPGLAVVTCSTTQTTVPDFAIALVLGTVILAALVKFGSIPLRLMIAVLLIASSALLIQGVIRPVKTELARAKPAVEEIRNQYGEDLTCMDWYDLESSTRFGVPTNNDPRFDAVDPGLVQEALEDGTDIYLWPIWVVPALALMMIMLGVAFISPKTKTSKWVVRIAVALAVIGCLSALPTDYKTNSAIQCMAE